MKKLSLVLVVTSFFFFTCNEHASISKSGKEVFQINCLSCHNYTKYRSMYQPSVYEMAGMSKRLINILSSESPDSIHLYIVRDLSKGEKDSLIVFILAQNQTVEDKIGRKKKK